MKANFKEIVIFLIGGAAGSVSLFAVYYLLLWLGVSYPVSYAAGFVVSVIAAYFINKLFVFRKKGQSGAERAAAFGKTAVIYSVAFIVSEALLLLFVEKLGMDERLASPLAAFCTTPGNYLLNKYWAFRKQ